MKILFLGYKNCKIIEYLKKNHEVIHYNTKINLENSLKINPDWIISYGYRFMIESNIINKFKNKIINLHISYLPHNRGAFPNFWSVVDNTKKGVTIHVIDEGLDTGDILIQKEVHINNNETLKSSYDKLNEHIQDLFIEKWEDIKNLTIKPKKQQGQGSVHSYKHSKNIIEQTGVNWEMTISEVKLKTDEQIIDEIKNIRHRNNEHWMDVVKLAFKLDPIEARSIFKKIKHCDEQINSLLKCLANNDNI